MRLIVAAELRRRRAALALLAVLAAVWLGAVATSAAGARRTDSAVSRFERRTSASDAMFAVASFRPQDATALRSALEARPEVVTSDLVWGAGTGLAYDGDGGLFVNLVAPVEGTWGVTIDRPILLEGRLADASRADEVVVTSETADLLHLALGDRLTIPTWDKVEWDEWLTVRGPYPPFDGPKPTVTVVGIVRTITDLTASTEDRYLVLATSAFHERWVDEIGANATQVVVRLRAGADIDAMVADLTTTLGLTTSALDADENLAAVRGATETLSTGLWLLAVAVGFSGGALVALAIAHELRQCVDRYEPLAALGMTRAMRILAFVAPLGVALAAGALLAALGSIVASARFPIGPGRLADPNPSIGMDWPVLGGMLAMLLVVLGIATAFGMRPGGLRRPATRVRGSALAMVDPLRPAVALGAMAATGRARRIAIPAMALTIAGILATTSFASSGGELRDDPARWGFTWSSSPESGFAPDRIDAALDQTMENPSVEGIAVVAHGDGFIDARPFTIAAIDVMRGSAPEIRVLSGRRPVDRGEIAVGENVARVLGAGVGSRVAVGSNARAPRPYTVVGLVVPPARLGATTSGDGAVVVWAAYAGDLELEGNDARRIAITYERGADVDAIEDALATDPHWVFDGRSHSQLPGDLANRLGTLVILPWLAGFFVIFGLSASAVAASRRSRRQVRDLGILRAMGFTGRDVRVFARAEAVTLVMAALAIGVPLGLRVGTLTWNLVMGDLGIDDHQASLVRPALATVGVVAVTILVASQVSARRAARIPAVAAIADERTSIW